MKELMNRIWKKEAGFSLIELIIVIAILAIIAAIAVPNLIENINNSRRTSDVSNAKIIADSIAMSVANDPTLSQSFAFADFEAGSTVGTIDAAADTLSDVIPVLQFDTGNNGTIFQVAMVSEGAIQVQAKTSGAMLFPDPDAIYE